MQPFVAFMCYARSAGVFPVHHMENCIMIYQARHKDGQWLDKPENAILDFAIHRCGGGHTTEQTDDGKLTVIARKWMHATTRHWYDKEPSDLKRAHLAAAPGVSHG